MKWCVAFTLLVLCSSCTPTSTTSKTVVVPEMRLSQVSTFEGTYYADKGSNNPKLASSRYLKTRSAGLLVTVKGASCYIDVAVLQEIPQGYYIKAEFPNPVNPKVPYSTGIVYKHGNKGFNFTSPAGMTGFKIGGEYKITLTVLKTQDSVEPVDVLVQKFLSYLDTTGKQIRELKK
jgi:hypothetical protein